VICWYGIRGIWEGSVAGEAGVARFFREDVLGEVERCRVSFGGCFTLRYTYEGHKNERNNVLTCRFYKSILNVHL
jgi:hypothetical protein